jgi:hypothetical protein
VELNFKKKTLRVKWEGAEYKVAFPSVRSVKEFQDEAKGKEGDIEPTIHFLNSLGLPEDICYDLEPDMLAQVVNTLSGVKKK